MKRSFMKYIALIGLCAAAVAGFAVYLIHANYEPNYKPYHEPATCPIKPGPNQGVLYERAKDVEDCYHPLCTVSVIKRNGDIYTLVTAGYCVARLDTSTGDTVLTSEMWYVSFDGKTPIKARVVGIGDLGMGDNLALLEIESLTPLYTLLTTD